MVDLIVTELGVIEVTPEGLVLREVAPGVTPQDVQKATEPKLQSSPDLKTMAAVDRGRTQSTFACRDATPRISLRYHGGTGFLGEAMEPHSIVVVSLHTPKEKFWGELLDISNAGVTMRGIDLNSFDDFVRQVLHPEGDRVGLPTLFFPMQRDRTHRAG